MIKKTTWMKVSIACVFDVRIGSSCPGMRTRIGGCHWHLTSMLPLMLCVCRIWALWLSVAGIEYLHCSQRHRYLSPGFTATGGPLPKGTCLIPEDSSMVICLPSDETNPLRDSHFVGSWSETLEKTLILGDEGAKTFDSSIAWSYATFV